MNSGSLAELQLAVDQYGRTAAADADPPAVLDSRVGNLLSSAGPLPPGSDWRRGLQWSLHDSRAANRRALSRYPGAATQCPDVSMCRTDKAAIGTAISWPTWLSYVGGCDLSDVPDWGAHVRAMLEAETSALLAGYLWTGISGLTAGLTAFTTESLSFESEADIVDATARHPQRAFAALTSAMRADGYHGRLWFHANDALLSHLLLNGLVQQQGGRFRLGDHVVVLDAGYSRDFTGQSASAAGEAWLVATGPVEVAVDPIVVVGPSDPGCLDGDWEATRFAFARFAGTPGDGAVKAARVTLWD